MADNDGDNSSIITEQQRRAVHKQDELMNIILSVRARKAEGVDAFLAQVRQGIADGEYDNPSVRGGVSPFPEVDKILAAHFDTMTQAEISGTPLEMIAEQRLLKDVNFRKSLRSLLDACYAAEEPINDGGTGTTAVGTSGPAIDG